MVRATAREQPRASLGQQGPSSFGQPRVPNIPRPSSLVFSNSVWSLLLALIMYSGSNSYLGGQGSRAGQSQYGNNSFQQQQQPQQPGPFNPQTTGYGAVPLQQNYTGYPAQSQHTGYQQQQVSQPQQGFQPGSSQFNNAQAPQQQAFQTGAPPMPQIPQQFQSQTQNPPVPAQTAQPTGYSQMADSFRATPSQPATTARGRRSSKAKAGAKIPSIRLSFITAQDQAKFETLFKSAVGDSQTLSGDKSRDLLLRSKLDGNSLGQIW